MIVRIWHGYTTPDNAPLYENLLYEEIWSGIALKKIKGYKGIELIKRELDNEIEFITIMKFESMESVVEFAGDNYEEAYVPAKARKILKRFDAASQHYKSLKIINY